MRYRLTIVAIQLAKKFCKCGLVFDALEDAERRERRASDVHRIN
jgi:hypothetical protein